MPRRFVPGMLPGMLTCLVVAVLAGLCSCGSDSQAPADGGLVSHDADFSKCVDSPAVPFVPNWQVNSKSGAHDITVLSAITEASPVSPGADVPEVGLNDWVVKVTDATTGETVTDAGLISDRPRMPLHTHGASTAPTITPTPGDPGTFNITKLDFFMAGYWEVTLHVQPAGGGDDPVVFAICIPS